MMPNQPYISALECERMPGMSFVMYGLWNWNARDQAFECVDTDADFYALVKRHSLANPVLVNIGPVKDT